MIFNIVQSTVQQKTLNKIKIFGSDGWPAHIVTFMSKPHSADINKGGQVPQNLYLHRGEAFK